MKQHSKLSYKSATSEHSTVYLQYSIILNMDTTQERRAHIYYETGGNTTHSRAIEIPSICSSVCLSHACTVTKWNNHQSIYQHYTKEEPLYFLTPTVFAGNSHLPPEIWLKLTHTIKKPTSTSLTFSDAAWRLCDWSSSQCCVSTIGCL